jgi:FtsP/CotA-like multicopper oxidase with cupredoxin domain
MSTGEATMNKKVFKLNRIRLAMLMLAGSTMVPAVSLAVDLRAVEGTWNSPGGPVTMWGFAADTGDCTTPAAWGIGPELTANPGDPLTVNLRNCLSEPVSIIIPGQPTTFTPVTTTDGFNRSRVTAFTVEAPADGGATTTAYTWSGLKAGTYLYQSGSHPAKQMQMGLYGALKVGSYPGTSGEVTLLFSEVDPDLHNPPTAANPLNYSPSYYLVNGQVSAPTIPAGNNYLPTVLRMLNAGLDFHVPALNGGYMSLVAEDGNSYPYPREQYSVHLPAGKTIDALWQAPDAGSYQIYDRRLSGMLANLAVSPGTGAPVPVDDAYSVPEDTALVEPAPGVLANETGTWTAFVSSEPSNGAVVLNSDGSFTYTPAADFNGTDSFQYMVNDGTYNSAVPATVTLTVTPVADPPIANDDAYDVETGATLTVAASGVLANDSDVDNQTLTAVQTSANSLVTLNTDGSFSYGPAGVPGTDSFTYEVYEDGVASGVTATATVTISAATTNTPPVATNDSYTTNSGVGITGNVITDDTGSGVDSDVDGDTLTVLFNSSPSNGVLNLSPDGSFTYTPNANFSGSDGFIYFIGDGNGGNSFANVSITVNFVNTAPVAVEDYVSSIPWNTSDNFINIVSNDTDAEGNLTNGAGNVTANRITLTTGSQTTRRGTVTVTDNGVLYTPRRNFRGTDTFNYTVTDLSGAVSNEVTVRINVVR